MGSLYSCVRNLGSESWVRMYFAKVHVKTLVCCVDVLDRSLAQQWCRLNSRCKETESFFFFKCMFQHESRGFLNFSAKKIALTVFTSYTYYSYSTQLPSPNWIRNSLCVQRNLWIWYDSLIWYDCPSYFTPQTITGFKENMQLLLKLSYNQKWDASGFYPKSTAVYIITSKLCFSVCLHSF